MSRARDRRARPRPDRVAASSSRRCARASSTTRCHVIVSRALPDVRDGLKPVHRRVLYSMWTNGNRPGRPYVKCANIVGYVMGNHHPHGDAVDLRHARAPRAAVLAALSARRRPGQLRLDRRRPGGRDALHRGAAREARRGDAARARLGHGRLRAELRRVEARAARAAGALPEPARQRQRRHRRRHGDQHPAAQPRRGRERDRAADRQARRERRGPDEARQGPRLPDRRDTSSAAPASATRTAPAAAASSCARAPTSRSCAAARARSSSPSCPTA